MNPQKIYLKPNVILEPLINQWYAWTLLVQPVTYALLLKHSHLRIMESFVKAPELHYRSAQKMAGGPFLHSGKESVGAIQALIQTSRQQGARLLELAEAVQELDQLLIEHAGGDSLAPLYERVPALLKGLVELGYDLQGHASARFIESLLYRSEFYRPDYQSMHGYLADSDDRSFMLSTPRVNQDRSVQIRLPFNHALYDQLFLSRSAGAEVSLIDALLVHAEGGESKRHVLEGWFTDTAAPLKPTPAITTAGAVRVRYFNHATVLVESADCVLMTDPIIGYPFAQHSNPFTFADLPERIDYVLLTHNHQDHIVLETLLQLRHRIRTLIVPRSHAGFLQDPSIKLALQACGFEHIIEIGEMESVTVPGGEIIGLPFLGEHGDLHIAAKMGFAVRLGKHSLMFAADSNNLQPELYQRISQTIGTIDTLFIGMECEGAPMSWLYGALLKQQLPRQHDQNRRLNGSDSTRAWSLVQALSPRRVYVYAMGAEPWVKFISSIDYTAQSLPIVESEKLIALCHTQDIEAERLYLKKEIAL